MKTTFSINNLNKDRIVINSVTDNMHSTIFITRVEFLELMSKMFDYRDAHIDEMREVVNKMKNG